MDPKASGWLVASCCAGALLAVVVLGWLPGRARFVHSDSLAPSSGDTSALVLALEKLDQRLLRIESALAVQTSRGSREPADAGGNANSEAEASSIPGTDGLEELHRDLLQMSKRIDLLAASLEESCKPAFSLPTLEQIHAARREVDWVFLNQVRELCSSDRDAARARVRLMTFDDMLRKVGLPTVIEADGNWCYYRTQVGDNGQPLQVGLGIRFVGDTVSSVSAIP